MIENSVCCSYTTREVSSTFPRGFVFFLRLRFNNSGDYLNVSVDSPQILAEEEIQEIPPQEENNDQKRYRIKREERQPHDFRLSYVPAVV